MPTPPLSAAVRWCTALLCLVVALSGCQRATPCKLFAKFQRHTLRRFVLAVRRAARVSATDSLMQLVQIE